MVARSHLIVAGIGTVALLSMAGTAIWMALPSDSGEELVRRAAAAPEPVLIPEPKTIEVEAPLKEASAAITPDLGPTRGITITPAVDEKNLLVPQEDVAAAAVDPNVAPLDPANPRWVEESAAKGAKPKAADVAAVDEPSDDQAPADTLNAYADDEASADDAATSAIPSVKPTQDAQAEQPAKKQASGRQSRAVRAVTMRSRPSSRGGVLGTVPARADVQVVSCDHWCEIVYKGKRGFVYRSFLRNNGK